MGSNFIKHKQMYLRFWSVQLTKEFYEIFSRLDQMLVDKKIIGHRCRVFASGRPVRISTKFKSNQTCPPNQTAHEQVSKMRSFDSISLRGHEFVKFFRQSCYRQL